MPEETMQRQSSLLRQQQITMEALQSELLECQAKMAAMRRQYDAKIDSILNQFNDMTDNDALEDVKLYKKQLDEAIKERQVLTTENSQLLRELQALKTSAVRNNILDSEYTDVIQIMEDETERLRKDVIKSEQDKVEVIKINNDYKKKVERLEEMLTETKKEISELNCTVANLQSKLSEETANHDVTRKNWQTIQEEKNNLVATLSSVKDRLIEGEKKVAETLNVAEEAVFEKDAALLREKNALGEINRLHRKTEELLKESSENNQNEISKVKENYNAKIKSLSEHIVQLEMEVNEKSLDFDRLMIEKQKMEKEIANIERERNKIRKERKEETSRMTSRLSNLERKNLQMLREKEDTTRTLDKLTKEYKANMDKYSERIMELEASLMKSDRENGTLKSTIDEMKSSTEGLQEEMLREKGRFVKQEKFLLGQLSATCRELESKKFDFEAKMESRNRGQEGLVEQLSSSLEALQKRLENLKTMHKSQLHELEMKNFCLKEKYDGVIIKKEALQESLDEKEAKLSIAEEANKEYKARLLEVEKELEHFKNQVSAFIRSSGKQ